MVWDKSILTKSGSTMGYLQKQETISKVVISEGIEVIGDYAFYNSLFLQEVVLPSTCKTIGDEAFSIDGGSLGYNSMLTNIELNNGLQEIGHRAFWNTALQTITIPNSVTTIGSEAFQYTELQNVTISNSVTTVGSGTFSRLPSTAQITCQVPSKPDGWDSNWTDCTNIVWQQ